MQLVSKKNIKLNRKMISELSIQSPESFDELVKLVQS